MNTKLANWRGVKVVQSPLSSDIWSQGFGSTGGVQNNGPLYISQPSDPVVSVVCTGYGGGCGPSGMQVHIPAGSQGAPMYDKHYFVIDPTNNVEIDCEVLRENGDHTPDTSDGHLSCLWAGYFSLDTWGLNGHFAHGSNPGNGSGTALGAAAALWMLTPPEMLGGINHMLSIGMKCLNAPAVFPAGGPAGGTDQSCGGSGPPHYGDIIQYVGQSDAQIASSSRSTTCKNVLTALHDYGGVFGDTGSPFPQIATVEDITYTTDPAMGFNLYPQVYADLAAHGDGSGIVWQNCFNNLSNADFNLVELTPPN